MNTSIFKAYDIRGKYPQEINEEAASNIAEALASKLFQKGKIVIARDARLSGPALYQAVLDRFKVQGSRFKVYEVGLATTPMFYFLVNELKAEGGVMVTASHNPKEYNGLKIVGPKAAMVSGKEVEKLLRN